MTSQFINPIEQIRNPNTGLPVLNAQIYFGKQDATDADTNPASRINVYSVGSGGALTLLAQPVRTNAAGNLVNGAGAPVSIQVELATGEDAYSILAKTAAGVQVLYVSRVYAPVKSSDLNDFVKIANLANAASDVSIAGVKAKYVARKYKNTVTVEDYENLVVGNDWTAAIQAALSSGAKRVECETAGPFIVTQPLTIPDFVIFDLKNATIVKNHNGDLVSSFGKRAFIDHGIFDGVGATYAGRGIVIDQGDSSSFADLGLQTIQNSYFINFRSYSIDYPTGGRGTFSKVKSCAFIPLPVSAGGGGVAVRWPDDFPLNNGNRHLTDCYSADTLLVIGNTQNGFIRNNTVGVPDAKSSVVFVGNPLKIIFEGNRFAHGTNLMTIKGQEHSFTGNIISSEIAFDPTCLKVHWASDNVCTGFNGFVPWGTNSINTDTEVQFTPLWASTGTQPSFGNADVRASYSVSGRMVRGTVQIIFGSTSTYGTGDYSFGLPLLPATYTKKYASAAWVQGFPCVAWVDPINGILQLYQQAGAIVSGTSPVVLGSGSTIIFGFEYEMG